MKGRGVFHLHQWEHWFSLIAPVFIYKRETGIKLGRWRVLLMLIRVWTEASGRPDFVLQVFDC